ncbi:hypothetical protein [Sorangium sp. So ce131]|uniref:hypothetical protein n=1 Tax=Sorangium sp. So ce131 TaxID=3133282 RepID=UPI003F619BF8
MCEPRTGSCTIVVIAECTPPVDGGTDIEQLVPSIPADIGLCVEAGECPPDKFCVSGVCCDTPCTEPCFSCVLPGSLGRCTLEPMGVDLHHDCGLEGACLSTCGPEGRCMGAGPGTQCAPWRCIDEGRAQGPAYCPSEGAACNLDAREELDCNGFRCNPVVGWCYDRCTSVAECAPGWVCGSEGTCVAPPSISAGRDPGCSAAPHGDGNTPWLAALLSMGLLASSHQLRRARCAGSLPSGAARRARLP